jgi:chromate transporter
MALYWSLFVAFFKVGFFGYGGGPALIPLIQNEVVKVNGWLTI